MIRKIAFGCFLLLVAFGCIDRVFFDMPSPDRLGLSISGHISNNGGPHRVSIFKNFDVQSRDSTKIGWTATHVVISDNEGNSAELLQVSSGVYETKVNDIIGKIGGVYKLRVELRDGRVYESLPDTLPEGGSVDSVYYDFVSRQTPDGYSYDYIVYANGSSELALNKTHLMWTNKLTYKATTRPLLDDDQCYRLPNGVCNWVPPCSGWRNIGSTASRNIVFDHECECCTCWYEQFGTFVLSDSFVGSGGRFPKMQIDRVEQTAWNMMYKMRFEVRVQGLSNEAFRFWRAVRSQRDAVTNIFQPATGKIPGNIVQTNGTASPAGGIFYACSLASKAIYVQRGDQQEKTITEFQTNYGKFPCYKLAPNPFINPPDYWVE